MQRMLSQLLYQLEQGQWAAVCYGCPDTADTLFESLRVQVLDTPQGLQYVLFEQACGNVLTRRCYSLRRRATVLRELQGHALRQQARQRQTAERFAALRARLSRRGVPTVRAFYGRTAALLAA